MMAYKTLLLAQAIKMMALPKPPVLISQSGDVYLVFVNIILSPRVEAGRHARGWRRPWATVDGLLWRVKT